VHDRAAALRERDGALGHRDGERQVSGVHMGRQGAEQGDLGLQGGAGGRVLRCPHDPAGPFRVDHDGRVDAGRGVRGAPHVDRVEVGDGDRRQGGKDQRRTGHRITVGATGPQGTPPDRVSATPPRARVLLARSVRWSVGGAARWPGLR